MDKKLLDMLESYGCYIEEIKDGGKVVFIRATLRSEPIGYFNLEEWSVRRIENRIVEIMLLWVL